MKKQEIRNIISSLKKCIKLFDKEGISCRELRSRYAEIYVASRLLRYNPQLGNKREDTGADIYLKKIGKRIEVKAGKKYSMTGNADWAWTFGVKQISDKKFDFCVLLGFEDEIDLKEVFILSYDDIKNIPLKRPDLQTEDSTYIAYYKDYKNKVSKKEQKKCIVEYKLNTQPKEYENKWDKIR